MTNFSKTPLDSLLSLSRSLGTHIKQLETILKTIKGKHASKTIKSVRKTLSKGSALLGEVGSFGGIFESLVGGKSSVSSSSSSGSKSSSSQILSDLATAINKVIKRNL